MIRLRRDDFDDPHELARFARDRPTYRWSSSPASSPI